MMVLILVVNVVVTLPRVAWAYTETYGNDQVVVCVEVGVDLVDPSIGALHGLVILALCFFLPLAIAWSSYVGVGFVLTSRNTVRKKPGTPRHTGK